MKLLEDASQHGTPDELSVSSNGSTWVKQASPVGDGVSVPSFSILERIDVGETIFSVWEGWKSCCLSVSSNGSTWVKLLEPPDSFDLGELSVSSNGSTWVKLYGANDDDGYCYCLSVSSNGSTWVKRSVVFYVLAW